MEQMRISRRDRWRRTWRLAVENKALYLMILPAFLYVLIFHYLPMYGVQIAFRNFNFADGITGSEWVGMKWFNYFFRSNNFVNVVRQDTPLFHHGVNAIRNLYNNSTVSHNVPRWNSKFH